jgi:hypothetical protein
MLMHTILFINGSIKIALQVLQQAHLVLLIISGEEEAHLVRPLVFLLQHATCLHWLILTNGLMLAAIGLTTILPLLPLRFTVRQLRAKPGFMLKASIATTQVLRRTAEWISKTSPS